MAMTLEADTAVGVPTVEVLGLGEIGVAAQEHRAEAAAEADFQTTIDFGSGAFMAGPIAAAVDDAQNFAGVGQGQEERMVTPGAVVGDVHALLAAAAGFHERAVHVDDSAFEEIVGLAGPSLDAGIVEDVLQRVDVSDAEAPAEVAGGGGIGNTASAQGIQEDFIVAT
jgi:hypothetical protein